MAEPINRQADLYIEPNLRQCDEFMKWDHVQCPWSWVYGPCLSYNLKLHALLIHETIQLYPCHPLKPIKCNSKLIPKLKGFSLIFLQTLKKSAITCSTVFPLVFVYSCLYLCIRVYICAFVLVFVFSELEDVCHRPHCRLPPPLSGCS